MHVDAHVVDAVEEEVEALAVFCEEFGSEGCLVFVFGAGGVEGAELDGVGDVDAVADGVLVVICFTHVLFSFGAWKKLRCFYLELTVV